MTDDSLALADGTKLAIHFRSFLIESAVKDRRAFELVDCYFALLNLFAN